MTLLMRLSDFNQEVKTWWNKRNSMIDHGGIEGLYAVYASKNKSLSDAETIEWSKERDYITFTWPKPDEKQKDKCR